MPGSAETPEAEKCVWVWSERLLWQLVPPAVVRTVVHNTWDGLRAELCSPTGFLEQFKSVAVFMAFGKDSE